MLFLLDTEYPVAWVRIRASVLWDDNALARNVARSTVLISTCLDKAASGEGEADTAAARIGGATETLIEVTIDRDGPIVV